VAATLATSVKWGGWLGAPRPSQHGSQGSRLQLVSKRGGGYLGGSGQVPSV
jgi:hypothetical protein